MIRPVRTLAGVLLLSIGAGTHSPAPAQQHDAATLIAAIDSLAGDALRNGPNAGLAIGVAHHGHVLLAKGYGFADLEHHIPVTAETVFRLGSITKQFTGIAVMQLVEQGKLRLDEPLSRFFPDYPEPGRRATVEQLLDHTSGIRNYTAIAPRLWAEDFRHDLTHEQLIALFQNEPPDFEPGRGYSYSNSAFYLLGVIIEQVTGQPYADYLREHVFAPTGMHASSYCDERAIVLHRAEGYEAGPNGLVNASFISMNVPGAAGAACSTVLDLLTWHRALAEHRLVGAESFRRLTEPVRLPDGLAVPYGGGLATADLEGHRKIGHGGSINGFLAMAYYYPDDELSVVVLANTTLENTHNPGMLEERIARLVLDLPPPLGEAPLAAAERRRYVGRYAAGSNQQEVIEQENGLAVRLGFAPEAPVIPLRHVGNHLFQVGQSGVLTARFIMDGKAAGRLVVTQAGIPILVADRGRSRE